MTGGVSAHRRLIVSADDLGLHEAINHGVVEAHLEGIVTSASMVACGPAFDHACRQVRPLPSLDLGIHLTLVEEEPLLGSQILRTLAPTGSFPATYRELFLRVLAGSIELREVELELDAQIQRVLDSGLVVTHLDSHQHTHFFPPIRRVLLTLAERYRIPAVRASDRVVPARTKFSFLLAPLAKSARRAARSCGLRSPDCLWLPSPSGAISVAALVSGIERLPPGVTELVAHPGTDQAGLTQAYPAWSFDWRQDLEALKSKDAREALARHEVVLATYRDL